MNTFIARLLGPEARALYNDPAAYGLPQGVSFALSDKSLEHSDMADIPDQQ